MEQPVRYVTVDGCNLDSAGWAGCFFLSQLVTSDRKYKHPTCRLGEVIQAHMLQRTK